MLEDNANNPLRWQNLKQTFEKTLKNFSKQTSNWEHKDLDLLQWLSLLVHTSTVFVWSQLDGGKVEQKNNGM